MDSRSAALENLLLDLFDEAELRRFFERVGLSQELPNILASKTELIHVAVAALERHGRIDRALFEGLAEIRPQRRAAIGEVEHLYREPIVRRSPEWTNDKDKSELGQFLTLVLDVPYLAWRDDQGRRPLALLLSRFTRQPVWLYPAVPGSTLVLIDTTEDGAKALQELMETGELSRILRAAVSRIVLGDLTAPGKPTTPEATTRLVELLKSLFTAAELQEFLAGRRQTAHVVDDITWMGSRNQVFNDAVRTLQRHGCVDQSLFVDLIAVRPEHAAEVVEVAKLWVPEPDEPEG